MPELVGKELPSIITAMENKIRIDQETTVYNMLFEKNELEKKVKAFCDKYKCDLIVNTDLYRNGTVPPKVEKVEICIVIQ